VIRVRVGSRQHADFPSEACSREGGKPVKRNWIPASAGTCFALLSLRERNRARSVLTGASSLPIPHPSQLNIDILLITALGMLPSRFQKNYGEGWIRMD